MIYLVAYDISSDKRRRKVEKLLKSKGERVNLSVFECRLDPDGFDNLRLELRHLIHSKDHIRIYSICNACIQGTWELGRFTERDPVIEV